MRGGGWGGDTTLQRTSNKTTDTTVAVVSTFEIAFCEQQTSRVSLVALEDRLVVARFLCY